MDIRAWIENWKEVTEMLSMRYTSAELQPMVVRLRINPDELRHEIAILPARETLKMLRKESDRGEWYTSEKPVPKCRLSSISSTPTLPRLYQSNPIQWTTAIRGRNINPIQSHAANFSPRPG